MADRTDLQNPRESSDGVAASIRARRQPLLEIRFWLIAVAFLVVGILLLNDTMLYTPDAPRYLVWTKSLAAFEGFRDATNPDPTRYVVHAPLYPVLLAPLGWFFVDLIIPAKVLTLVFGLVLLVLVYLWVSRTAGTAPALVAVAILALNPLILLFSTHVLSDIPFAITVVLFFLFAQKVSEEPDRERFAWLLVAVITLGVFLREVGLMLLAAAACYFLIRKDRHRLLLVVTIPLLFYLIWFFRNEVFVATAENPPMRNTKIFLAHYFTVDDAGLMEEFAARLKTNLAVYGEMAKGVLFFPQYVMRPFPVISPSAPLMGSMASILQIAQYPIAALQACFFLWGMFVGWKRGISSLLLGLFLLFYLTLILLYPFNDIRFLVPFLLVLVYYGVLGIVDISTRFLKGRLPTAVLNSGFSVLLVVLLMPNALWTYNAIRQNREYQHHTASSFQEFKPSRNTPELYSKPFSIVGKWLVENSDSATVVASRWKELAFWLKDRKLLEVEPLASLTLFETLLRDHKVGYLVVLVSNPGLRELEFQMQQSRRFAFETAFRSGNLEVVRVTYRPLDISQKGNAHAEMSKVISGISEEVKGVDEEGKVRSLFRLGVRLLERGEYERAGEVFQALWGVTGGSGAVVLFRAIALEFAGKFDEAQKIFDRFRYQPQAGPFLKHAWYHEQLMWNIQRAEEDSTTETRSMIYHMVSVNYWDLGFRYKASEVLNNVLKKDSAFSPALIFGSYYALQNGEYEQAKAMFRRLQVADPRHLMAAPLRSLFQALDSLRSATGSGQKTSAQLSVARIYASMGLAELAIDHVLLALMDDPDNAEALKGLADLYEQKRRNAPAIHALNRLLVVEPMNALARAKRDSLVSLR